MRIALWCVATLGLGATLALGSLAGCVDSGGPSDTGARLEIEIAPLDLPGIADAVWDIEVQNNASPPERVWARRLTSSRYGDGAGSASYVGPCDAAPNANSNTITVHIRGIYASALPANGAGEFGDAAPIGGEAFNDPGDLQRTFVCLENQDVAVQFDVSLMRPANQGFFDIAVNFNQIYCSAKFDCCDVDGDPAGDDSTCQASEYKDLLFNGTQRDRTYVLGFACTVGDGSQYNTTLMLDDLVLTCDGSAGGPASGTYTLDVDPALSPGNQGSVTAAHLFEWATYRGEEFVSDTISKAYWNVALGVGNMAGCVLTTKGTADDLANTEDHVGVSGPTIDANTTYPVIHWNIDLSTCTEHPLNQTSSVNTTYTPTVHDGLTFDHRWIPGAPAAFMCSNGVQDGDETAVDCGGACTATCARSCQEILAAQPTAPDGTYSIDPDGAGGAAPFDVLCDMSDSDGGWTQLNASMLASLTAGTYEYLFTYAPQPSAWYRSPSTTALWSWSTFVAAPGTWNYSDNAGALNSFSCVDNESGQWGVGCSNGGGNQWKAIPAHSKDEAAGTTEICQDQPDVFAVGACAAGAQVWVREVNP